MISKIYRKLIQLNIKKTSNLNKKWAKNIDTSPQRTYEKMLNIANNEGNKQTKKMRYHLISVRMAIIKKSINNKYLQGCGERETLVYCWQDCKFVQSLWKTVWRFL